MEKREKREKSLEIINLIMLIVSVIIPLIFFILTSPEEIHIQTYIIFGVIALALIVGGFVTYVIARWKTMVKNIQDNKNVMEDIKKDLDFKTLWNKMDVRLKVLENITNKFFEPKKKKGQIDPRIIFWIILIILLYLFLKSTGIFN